MVESRNSTIFNQSTAEGKLHLPDIFFLHLPDNFKLLDLYQRLGFLKLNHSDNKALKHIS